MSGLGDYKEKIKKDFGREVTIKSKLKLSSLCDWEGEDLTRLGEEAENINS